MIDAACLFSPENRIALVTDAARGIGAMIAEGLAASGARVLNYLTGAIIPISGGIACL